MWLEEKNFGQFLDIRAPVSGDGFEPKRTVSHQYRQFDYLAQNPREKIFHWLGQLCHHNETTD